MKKLSLLSSLFLMFLMFGSLINIVSADSSTVTNIVIKTSPTKVNYVVGNKLNLVGLIVTLTKSDSATPVDVPFSNFTANQITTSIPQDKVLAVGDTAVVISVNGKSVTQAITISSSPARIEGISIKTMPTKVRYNVGEKLDLSGLSVEIRKSSGSPEVVPFITPTATVINPFATFGITTIKNNGAVLTQSDSKVIVRIGKNISTSFNITVVINNACIVPLVTKREAAIGVAYDQLTTVIKASLLKRKTAVIAAWVLEGTTARNDAIKAAWNTFRTEQKAARKTYTTTIKKVWFDWKTDLKTCKINPSAETEAVDIIN